MIDDVSEAVRVKDQPPAIFISASGTILAGFGNWKLAVLDGKREINCIEYPLSEDESLHFILTHHHSRRRWNAFIRIRLALTLEPYFQQRALENMCAGGRYKGLATLPDLQRIDVRREIADVAGVGGRNVGNVKKILQTAHPGLIEALRDGRLTINGAMQFCKFPQAEQLEQFIRYSEECAINKVIRRFITGPKEEKARPDAATVLDALQFQEAHRPGSVVVLVGRLQHTVILVGRDLLTGPYSQKKLELR